MGLSARAPIPWDLGVLKDHFAPSHSWDNASLCVYCDPGAIGGRTLKITTNDNLKSILKRYGSPTCFLCRVYWNALAQFTDAVSQIKHFWVLSDGESESEGPNLTTLKWNGTSNSGKENTIGNTIELYSLSGAIPPSVKIAVASVANFQPDEGFFTVRPTIPRDLESQQYWTKWREHIDYCNTEHEICNNSTSGFTPTRLLDLSPESGPVLVNRNNASDPTLYAALSYCWGGVSFIRTTTLNIESHQRGIPMSSLPLLFRDIVQITLKLGLRYLWIDSLCIIQDSKLDWELESAKMGELYAQSFVVLAAGASRSPLEGLVLQRPEPVVVDTMDIPEFGDMPIYAREPLEHPYWSRSNYLRQESSVYLQRRGWCYQENWLASRVLTLLPWETIYKCKEEIHCECGDPWNSNIEDKDIIDGWGELTGKEVPIDENNLTQFWETLVQQYSSLSLSFHADKLPAFSGIAATFQRESCGQYLAGLWESLLPGALFWTGFELGDERPFPQRPENTRAPSWSWASVEGGVFYYDTGLTYKADTILECRATPSGKNPYGEVEEGCIKMRVPVVPLIKFKELCKALETKAQAEQKVSEILDDEYHQEYDDLSNFTGWAQPHNLPRAFDSPEDVEADAKSELFCAGFACYTAEEQRQVWQTMILRKCGNKDSTFRRAGVLLQSPIQSWASVSPQLYQDIEPSIVYLT